MIALSQAQECVLERCAPLGLETIVLGAAHGRVLAETIVAREDLVPFARSAMDGFALDSAQTAASRDFAVRGAVFAGDGRPQRHASGTASAVATGAAMPLGSDAVVPFEDVARQDGSIRLSRAVQRGEHVFPPGEDARRGDELVAGGTTLEPAHLALLAEAGSRSLAVRRRPRVALICTGEELVDVGARPGYGQIRNSNATLLRSALAGDGAEIVAEETVRDERPALRDALRRACATADLVVTTGGASVGERDFVKALLLELGAVFAFDSVAMRPGRPTAFATLGRARVAVLPGNPAAVFVALQELVRPALGGLRGCAAPRLPRLRARLTERVHAKRDRTYLPFVMLRRADGLCATPLPNQCSALTRTAAAAQALAIIEPSEGDRAAGDTIAVDLYSHVW